MATNSPAQAADVADSNDPTAEAGTIDLTEIDKTVARALAQTCPPPSSAVDDLTEKLRRHLSPLLISVDDGVINRERLRMFRDAYRLMAATSRPAPAPFTRWSQMKGLAQVAKRFAALHRLREAATRHEDSCRSRAGIDEGMGAHDAGHHRVREERGHRKRQNTCPPESHTEEIS